eukprot:TRINITY_DN130_c0_g1_i1.p1 TRINITY_DN130_c0_g1~~TRINITY_DN130_c0_g1_i1.p1  ORF type:complete len:232 (-),score=36.55 TRINITY_DN130_c0_g1_i1:120-815(-)
MYDSAITIFSPNGHLFQVEYALEAVKKGLCSLAIRCKDGIVLGVERKTISKLQEPRTVKKILQLDENLGVAFAGLNADARILANMIRMQCQSFRLSYEDDPSVEYMSKYVAQTMQKFTQKGGVRPFGISLLLAGFDSSKKPRLFQVDPSGACIEWKANSLGRNSKQVKEFLEKQFKQEMEVEEGLKITCKALMDVVESGKNNIELAVVRFDGIQMLTDQEVEKLVDSLEEK